MLRVASLKIWLKRSPSKNISTGQVKASVKVNFNVVPALVSSGNKVKALPASLEEVKSNTKY